ncbi:non-ribosomal peptide synthase, partial [Herbaspirillum sp. CF444]|uniref:condensation domain-containing protein n=1 Tax=Herbaspirillum sp. CF444 TaxID=1144319 RepID=UPI0002724BBE
MSEVLTPSPDELLAVSRAYVALSADKRKAFRARIKAKGIDASRLPIVPFPSRGARLPLSHAQERLWFLWRLDPHSAAYNIAGAVRIEGRLEVADVRLALEQMVARHESLSNTFIEEDDAVWQIAGQKNAAQKAYGWSELAPPAAGEGIADVLQGLARQPFDLIAGPLLRVTLIRCAEQEHVLHFSMHHIISDGWSMDVLNKEFSEACRAARSGAAASLSPLPIQYGDYTLWQRDWVDAEAMDKQLNFWRERLGSTQAVLELPLSRMRSGMRSGEGGREESLLAPALLAQLRALAQQHDASLFMLLLAAYDILLARYSGQQDIRIGVPAAGRERLETAPLIGFFVNTLVIRSELDGLLTFGQLLEHVRERVLEAHAHQDLPFARLVDALQPERSLSHSPLFQAMFNFSVVRDEDMALPGLRVSRLQGAIETSRFDLVLNVVDASTPVVAFNYSNDVLDAPVIRRLLGHYVEILTQLAAHGSMLPLGSLHLSQARGTEQEQARSRADYPFNPVAQRISARALAQPQAPALHCEGQRLSYGQLEQWASQVGRRLHEAGVRAEERVGLCVTRSVGMVAGLLGIFKSGGAFLPLDPDYPADRLALMLEDAGVRTVLADADTATQLADVLAGYQVIRIDQLDGVSDQPFHMPVLADQLAYVIYTSGSTGRPKGVAISQRAL